MHETKHPPRVDATARRLAPRAPARAHTPRARAPRSRSRSLPWMARDTARAATSPIPRVVRVARAYIHIYIRTTHIHVPRRRRGLRLDGNLAESGGSRGECAHRVRIACACAGDRDRAWARGRGIAVGRSRDAVCPNGYHASPTHTHPPTPVVRARCALCVRARACVARWGFFCHTHARVYGSLSCGYARIRHRRSRG